MARVRSSTMKGESQVNWHLPCPVGSENSLLGYGLEETLSLGVLRAVELNVNPCVKPKAVPPKKTRYIADPAASSLRQSNWVSISRKKPFLKIHLSKELCPYELRMQSIEVWRPGKTRLRISQGCYASRNGNLQHLKCRSLFIFTCGEADRS